jgi:hypothetical protein
MPRRSGPRPSQRSAPAPRTISRLRARPTATLRVHLRDRPGRQPGDLARITDAVWATLAGERDGGSRRQQLNRAAIRTAFPACVWAVNRLLRSHFDPDVSGESIFRGGLTAATELAARLGVDRAHVINGHTHRGGPFEGEPEWTLPGGGRLHNTGSWCFASAFHRPGTPPGPYWPGTVTWVEEEGPPRRVRLLMNRAHAELIELNERPLS